MLAVFNVCSRARLCLNRRKMTNLVLIMRVGQQRRGRTDEQCALRGLALCSQQRRGAGRVQSNHAGRARDNEWQCSKTRPSGCCEWWRSR